MTLVLAHRGPDEGDPTLGNPGPVTSSAPPTTSSVAVPAPAPTRRQHRSPAASDHNRTNDDAPADHHDAEDLTCGRLRRRVRILHSLGDQWPDDPYLDRWMLERHPDLPPNQAINILETAFHDPACQGPA